MKDISANIIWIYDDGRETQNLIELDLNKAQRGYMNFKIIVEGEVNEKLSILVGMRHVDSGKRLNIFNTEIEAPIGDSIQYTYYLKNLNISFNGDGEYTLQVFIIPSGRQPELSNLKSSFNLKVTGFEKSVNEKNHTE